MRTVNVHEAKTHLSRLIADAVENGEGFVIAKAGKPLVKVEPLTEREPSALDWGFMKGSFDGLITDFDRHDPEIEALFAGDASPECHAVAGGADAAA